MSLYAALHWNSLLHSSILLTDLIFEHLTAEILNQMVLCNTHSHTINFRMWFSTYKTFFENKKVRILKFRIRIRERSETSETVLNENFSLWIVGHSVILPLQTSKSRLQSNFSELMSTFAQSLRSKPFVPNRISATVREFHWLWSIFLMHMFLTGSRPSPNRTIRTIFPVKYNFEHGHNFSLRPIDQTV